MFFCSFLSLSDRQPNSGRVWLLLFQQYYSTLARTSIFLSGLCKAIAHHLYCYNEVITFISSHVWTTFGSSNLCDVINHSHEVMRQVTVDTSRGSKMIAHTKSHPALDESLDCKHRKEEKKEKKSQENKDIICWNLTVNLDGKGSVGGSGQVWNDRQIQHVGGKKRELP